MSLAGELEAAKQYRPKRQQCSVCAYIDTLDTVDRDALTDALASPMLTTAIHEALKRMNAGVALSALNRHRRKDCRGLAR